MKLLLPRMFALIVYIAASNSQNLIQAQTAGKSTNVQQLPSPQSLLIDCRTNDTAVFIKQSKELSSLQHLTISGNVSSKTWEQLFQTIRQIPSLKSIEFSSTTFNKLPYGYEYLSSIEELSIDNSSELDFTALKTQIADLLNLNSFTANLNNIGSFNDEILYVPHLKNIFLHSSYNDKNTSPTNYDFYFDRGNRDFISIKYMRHSGKLNDEEYATLVSRFNPVRNSAQPFQNDANIAYIPTYNFVKPPIDGLNIEYKLYTINPTIENTITANSGTKIYIPSNAFRDKNGNPPTGDITISYREFRDPVDFMVSGIPMKYDSGGVINNFESAGMFEINASSNNEPLKLAQGKQIKMDFVSTSPDSTYNFYAFNDSSGNWDYLGKPKNNLSEPDTGFKILSDAYSFYRQFLAVSRIYFPPRYAPADTTELNDRFNNLNYVFNDFIDSAKRQTLIRNEQKNYRYNNSMYRSIKLNRVRKLKDGDLVFKIRSENNFHPELSSYSNVYFALQDNIPPQEFKKNYAGKNAYNDIRLYRNGDNIEIKLKSLKEFKTIKTTPVFINDKREAQQLRSNKSRINSYERHLKKREKRFNKRLIFLNRKQKQKAPQTEEEAKKDAYAKCKKFMSDAEKKMSYDNWMCYFNKISENEKQVVNNSAVNINNLKQSLTLDNMGIYNCDQIQRLSSPVEIFANYKNLNDKKIEPTQVYIIDKTVNAVMQYDGYRGYGPNKIAFSINPNSLNTMLAVNPDGAISIYRTEGFKQNVFSNKSRFTFQVEELGNKFSSVGELKKCIGL